MATTLAVLILSGAGIAPQQMAQIVADYFGISHIVVSSYGLCDELTPEDVRIEPELRSSAVYWYRDDATTLHQYFDEDGNLEHESESFSVPEPWDQNARMVSRASLRWRMVIPPIALVTGIAVMIALRFVPRRRAA